MVQTSEFEDMDLSGVTIEFWHMYGEGERGNEAITTVVDEFNATNDYGITVEHFGQGRTSDVQSKVNTALQSGDYPNIVRLYTSDFFVWDEVDVVTDLAPFINDPDYGYTAEEMDDFYPVPVMMASKMMAASFPSRSHSPATSRSTTSPGHKNLALTIPPATT